MQKIDIKAQRIKSHYMGEEGIQIMIPYVKGLTIFNGAGIFYHQYEGSDLYTNKYIEDDRRLIFPYSNIPIHYRKKRGYNFTMTNQLFDFNTPYISIGNGGVAEYYVLKENDEAILVKRYVDIANVSESTKTREEIENIVKRKNNEQKYIVGLDGGLATVDIPLDSEKEIHDYIKSKLEDYIEYLNNHYDVYNHNLELGLVKKNIENGDFGNLMDVNLLEGIVVRISEENNIDLKYLNIDYIADNQYKVVEEDIPVKRYNLEQVKCLVKQIKETNEPKISLFQNPSISKKDLKEAKQKVKELKK